MQACIHEPQIQQAHFNNITIIYCNIVKTERNLIFSAVGMCEGFSSYEAQS